MTQSREFNITERLKVAGSFAEHIHEIWTKYDEVSKFFTSLYSCRLKPRCPYGAEKHRSVPADSACPWGVGAGTSQAVQPDRGPGGEVLVGIAEHDRSQLCLMWDCLNHFATVTKLHPPHPFLRPITPAALSYLISV